MFIYKISLINSYAPLGDVSYYSSLEFTVGDVIEIEFAKKITTGIIIEKNNIKDNKEAIRNANFSLKKITSNKIVNTIEMIFLQKLIHFVSNKIITVGEVYFYLEKIIKFSKKSDNTIINKHRIDIFPDELSTKIEVKKNKNNQFLKISELFKQEINFFEYEFFFHNFSSENYGTYNKPYINYFDLILFIFKIFNFKLDFNFENYFFTTADLFIFKNIETSNNIKLKLNLLNNSIKVKKSLIKNNNQNNVLDQMINKITESYSSNKKIFVFILQHGFAERIYCNDCNYVVKCLKCKSEISLTQDDNLKILICKNCFFQENLNINKNLRCENCGSYNLKDFGLGIKKIEELLSKIDNIKFEIIDESLDKLSVIKIIKKVNNYINNLDVKILIGSIRTLKALPSDFIFDETFVISLGPLISSKEFYFDEKVIQILTQIELKSRKIYLQQQNQDELIWNRYKKIDKFYDEEIINRKISNYPPFTRVVNFAVHFKYKSLIKTLSFYKEINNLIYKGNYVYFNLFLNNDRLKKLNQELINFRNIFDIKISNIIEKPNFWKK